MKLLKKLDAAVGAVVSALGVASMIALFIVLMLNVIIRMLRVGISLSWYSEVVEILFAWMVMIGAVCLCRSCDHFRVDLLLQKLGHKRWYYWIEAVCYAVALGFYAYFFYYSANLAANAPQTLPVLHIAKGYCYACMPVCALLMCVYSLRDICVAIGRAIGRIPMVEIKQV